MDDKVGQLKRLIEASSRILVTSHISPDPDALCSLLITGTALTKNYPDKKIIMLSEELTGGLNFLKHYPEIIQRPLQNAIAEFRPELIIIVDAMNFSRCTRGDVQPVQRLAKDSGAKIAIIDHHQPEGIEPGALYINNGSPAATQDIYQIFLNSMGLEKPDGYAETALLGIISDTARFLYDNPKHRDTFSVVSELLDAGASIEELENKLSRHTIDEMQVLSELAKNLTSEADYNYSFVSDGFTEKWIKNNLSNDNFKLGCETFVSGYIRNIGRNLWGFIVYPDLSAGSGRYSVSFRAVADSKDVSRIAKALGGGGHKPAAGAKLEADSVERAINKIHKVILNDP